MTFGVHCSWNSPNLSAKLTGRYVMGAPLSIVEPHEARGRRSPHRHHPAVAVVALAVLDGLDRVVEALQRLADLSPKERLVAHHRKIAGALGLEHRAVAFTTPIKNHIGVTIGIGTATGQANGQTTRQSGDLHLVLNILLVLLPTPIFALIWTEFGPTVIVASSRAWQGIRIEDDHAAVELAPNGVAIVVADDPVGIGPALENQAAAVTVLTVKPQPAGALVEFEAQVRAVRHRALRDEAAVGRDEDDAEKGDGFECHGGGKPGRKLPQRPQHRRREAAQQGSFWSGGWRHPRRRTALPCPLAMLVAQLVGVEAVLEQVRGAPEPLQARLVEPVYRDFQPEKLRLDQIAVIERRDDAGEHDRQAPQSYVVIEDGAREKGDGIGTGGAIAAAWKATHQNAIGAEHDTLGVDRQALAMGPALVELSHGREWEHAVLRTLFAYI